MKKALALLLAVIMAFSLMPAAMAAEADEQTAAQDGAGEVNNIPQGDCTHGYVTDIKLWPMATEKQNLPGAEFQQDKTDYELEYIYRKAASMLMLGVETDPEKNLCFSVLLDGKELNTYGTWTDKEIVNGVFKPTNLGTMVFTKSFDVGTTKTLSVLVGEKGSDISQRDVYNFAITRTVGLDSLKVKCNDSNISLSPQYNPIVNGFGGNFLGIVEADTVKVTANLAYTTGVQLYIGNSEDANTASVTDYEINLQEYWNGEKDVAEIPIRLLYNEEGKIPGEKRYTIVLAKVDYTPEILVQPESTSCAKGETPTLSVQVKEPAEGATRTYQWYYAKTPISGATQASCTVPASNHAGRTNYYCIITDTVNGNAYSVKSETATVTVELTYVEKPVILLQPGTYSGSGSNTVSDYKKDYIMGQKFDDMWIRTGYPEDGVTYSLSFFHNTVNSYEGAEPVVGALLPKAESSGTSYDYAFRPDNGYPEGEYYIFCLITAADKDGRTAETYSDIVKLTYGRLELELEGRGTEAEPYLIKTVSDFAAIRNYVRDGQWCSGVYFKMDNDIALPADWEPIGCKDASAANGVQAFGGILDGGGHKLTVAKGGKTLFNYVSAAVIKNLNIYGEEIDGNGLIDKTFVDYGSDGNYNTGCPAMVELENVRLLSGSSTSKSGFMQGSGSGHNTINIRNCVVEEHVTIGYTKDQSSIGSFVGGSFNGGIDNCISYAEVYGTANIGGLIASKGQTMGPCLVRNSSFLGSVTATGDYIGGILGRGYHDQSGSAPNTPPVTIVNCLVKADITGGNYVGGILGAEPSLMKAIDKGSIRDNVYIGTIQATEDNAYLGGIIGYHGGISKILTIENNYFLANGEAELPVIGGVRHYVMKDDVDPDDPDHRQKFDPENGFVDENEINAWSAKTGSKRPQEDFTNGTVVELLNSSEDGYHNWVQGKEYPEHSSAPIIYKLEVSGKYKDTYYIGESLDLDGIEFTATWSDGTVTHPTIGEGKDDVKISGFNSSKRDVLTLTASYGAAKATFTVTVLKKPIETPDANKVTVSFTMYGDDIHGDESEGYEGASHTMKAKNLKTWIAQTDVTVDLNATVWDVIKQAAGSKYEFDTNENSGTVYIVGIREKGTEKWLAEFTNGSSSGWMYTINGEHSDNGVAQQFLENGDKIVLHYTDDYTVESGSEKWSGGSGGAAKNEVKAEVSVEKNAAGETVAKVKLPKGAASAVISVPTAELGGGNVLVLVKGDGSEEIIKKSLVDGEKAYALVKGDCTVKLADNGKQFADTANHWAKDAVAFAASHELFDGTGASSFSPDKAMSRAMLATVLYRLEDASASGTNPFADVAAGMWYTDAVIWANGEGIVGGTDRGFEPERDITREELAVMLYRYARSVGMDVSKSGALGAYTDGGDVSAWAKEAMGWAVANGLVSGRSSSALAPKGTATRAEVAAVMQRLVKLMVM